jgi:class 3 adenylate cyclase
MTEAGGLAPREERRVVTVVFVDLVGFTERAESLDPEDVRALLTTYYAQVRGELERHGGVVDKFIGDAVMAVFGAPVAHEDDPERAVRAALAIREWAGGRDDVDLRVGVNTGTALVALEPSATGIGMVAGDVVNTASRIQAAAPTDGVLVSEATYRATADVFDYREREPVEAKGKSEPVRVLEPLEARVELGRARRLGHAPLVGRQVELGRLRDAYERVTSDRLPLLVTLVGVPGIGKTRLVRELERLLDGERAASWLAGHSLSYGAGSSLSSLGELVKAHAGVLESDDAAEADAKLRRAVGSLTGSRSDAGWLLGHLRPLVGLAGDGAGREDGQAEGFAAWRRYFELLSASAPLVLELDDVHWADDAVLDFVDDLVLGASGPMLVVATARPELAERRPDWISEGERRATIALEPLSDEETMELVQGLAGTGSLAPELEEILLARAAGNPLYAEEFARMAAVGGSPDGALPESVHGIVAARLDVVPPEEKAILQDAAVLGQTFWVDALAHVRGEEPAAVSAALARLEHMEFVRRAPHAGIDGEAEYSFRHPLIREVAYEQVPRSRRARTHRLAAGWTETLPADRAEDRAEALAHHYENALAYSRAAGEPYEDLRAPAARALAEAGDHARALHSLDVAADRYRRALELGEEDGQDVAPLALALGEVELRAGSVADARSLLESVVDRARATGRPELLARAVLALGGLGAHIGDADEAYVALLEEAIRALGDDHADLRSRLLSRLAIEIYYAPPASRREELSDEAVRLARECGAAEALFDALTARHAALWSPDGLAERLAVVSELVQLAETIGDRERSLQARTWLVLDLLESGDVEAARAEIDEYARLAEPLGIPAYAWWVPSWRAMLAELEGRFDDARRLSAEARATGARASDRNAELFADLIGWWSDLEQGHEADRWRSLIEQRVGRRSPATAYRCGLAYHHAASGRLDEARRTLDELLPGGFASVTRDMNWLTAASEFVQAVGILGDEERARAAYPLLLPYADRNLVMARAAVCHGPAEPFLGRLAATAGDWSAAERHFEEGLEACERIGARPLAARTKAWYAEMLRSRDEPGDADRAESLGREASEEAAAMGLLLSPAGRAEKATNR